MIKENLYLTWKTYKFFFLFNTLKSDPKYIQKRKNNSLNRKLTDKSLFKIKQFFKQEKNINNNNNIKHSIMILKEEYNN